MTLLSLMELLLFPIAGCLGCWIRRLLRINPESAWERVIIDICMGLGILSLILFGFSAVGFMGRDALFVLGIIFILGIQITPFFYDLRDCIRGALKWRPDLLSGLTAILLLALAISALIPALAPPAGSDWDSLAYHLSIPKLYIQHGGFYRIDFASHSNFPFLMEMLYVHCLWFHDPVAAKLIHYGVGLLLVAVTVLLVRRHFNAKAAPLAAVALAGMPIVLWEATTAYVDLATALYTVLCVHLLLYYLDTNNRRYLILCGISAGFAASTKMTGLALVPVLAIWIVADRLIAAKRSFEWKGALVFAGVALLVCSPWYIKSLIYTGSPVYPFFYSIFGGRHWNQDLANIYSSNQAAFGMGHDFSSFAFLPYYLTFYSERFYDTPGLYIGPLVLIAMPVLFFARYRSRKLVGVLLFFISQMIIWFGLTQQSRYLIPAFAILAALIASLAYSDDRLRLLRPALWAAFIVIAIFGITTLVPAITTSAPVVLGAESWDAYLSRALDIYPAQKWMNKHLPKKAKVAFYGDTRGFYLDRDYVWADPGHNDTFTKNFGSVDEYVSYLKSQGVTHAMINFKFFVPPSKATGVGLLVYQAIAQGRFSMIYPDGDNHGSTGVYIIR